MFASEKEIQHLNALYADRSPFYGELHDHANTGGTSDGARTLDHWLGAMEALKLDFAAILDHRQVRHMYLPQWKDGVFIGGTEPGTGITDSKAEEKSVHYNMLFENAAPLEELLAHFEEYQFTGGPEGHFVYPTFTTERFRELITYVKEHGGFFVHPHPKQLMRSEDPCDYWFCDETGIEVFYNSFDSQATVANYALWTALLAAGKRVWACAGGDEHRCCSDRAITTIYATEKKNAAYLQQLRKGDFVCGSVGIRMCIGETTMGGQCPFGGQKLIFSVGDFHAGIFDPVHKYRVDLITDRGTVFSAPVSCEETAVFALDAAEDAAFYRVEVVDESRNVRIAIGNPIWNR